MDSTITSIYYPNISSTITGSSTIITSSSTTAVYSQPPSITIHIPKPTYYEVDINGDEIPRYDKKSIDKDELFDSLGIGIPLQHTWTPTKVYVRNDGTGNWENIGQDGDIMVRVGN